MQEILFEPQDRADFREWVNLNLMNVTWEGRYLDDFNQFWDLFFESGSGIAAQIAKFDYAKTYIKSGPAVSWFTWLEHKFYCYLFLKKNLDIKTLAQSSHNKENQIALILREFFIERFPHMEDKINELFLIGNVTSESIYLNFEKVKEKLGIKVELSGSLEEEVMANLEITLYGPFRDLLANLSKEMTLKSLDINHFKKKVTFKKQIRFFQELIVLFLIGGILIFGLKVGNKWYEDYLSKQITLFEPDFFWLDKTLSFKSNEETAQDIDLSFKELEELEKIESKEIFNDDNPELRFDTESEVVVTSVDSLPKDFDAVSLDQSRYEESEKGGYRDSRYGRRKAYRVMMTSVHPESVRNQVIKLLDYYQVEQVDTVEPGTKIPGGLYFNLYVPSGNLREFLSKVSAVEEATILESNTAYGGRSGKNKVFIWVKSI